MLTTPCSAQDLDRPRLFAVDLDQLVGIAESGRPRRYAVLENQETAAGPGTAEHRGAQRRLVILAAPSHDPRTRDLVEQLANVMVAGPLDAVCRHSFDATRILETRAGVPMAADDDLGQ
jgi:hypothetical protein